MPVPTRTIGPLHFEDLEPHRFEDLVRQLVYDFRHWRQLEATGRAGSDESFDIRGWEAIDGAAERDIPDSDADDNAPTADLREDRLWLVQCKRERTVGPTKLTRYLDAIPEAERSQLHGLIIAAACDFSKRARDEFRMKVREFGVSEGRLWGKAEIEDMLFQPKNDHLLFAYFGISLQVRRRTLKTEIRAKLVMKRQALKHLHAHQPVLIRDASDERYPWLDNEGADRIARGRWKVMKFSDCKSDGLHVAYGRHAAYLDDDGEHWDYGECMNDANVFPGQDPWRGSEEVEEEGRSEAMAIWNALPEQNRAWYETFLVMPYENVLAIDVEGDEWFDGPQIYTAPFHPTEGPFRNYLHSFLGIPAQWGGRHGVADFSKRVKRFPRRDEAAESENG